MAKAPGKAHREGISFIELADMFPDEETATKWFESLIWPNGRHCPRCGSVETSEAAATSGLPYYCSGCHKPFSVKIGTALERSRVPLRKWAIAIYFEMVSLKGVSSMRLHRDLKVTQKTAWFMQQRIREAWAGKGEAMMAGPVEVDETYVGGKMKNMHGDKRREARNKPDYGKTIVAGAKDRATGAVRAQVIEAADKETLAAFVGTHAAPDAAIYTDEARAYSGLPNRETVNHSAGEYVTDDGVSTNGIEALWAVIKRAQNGVYHKLSPKHLHRYVAGFAAKHNIRDADTLDQMASVVAGMVGKRLMYRDLIADNGLSSGART
ncbi:MAG: IS1595 family transposase [Rhodospirillaceae bacterium]|nr:IS1595 family transposase [Rhodospirillaceae bacterium]